MNTDIFRVFSPNTSPVNIGAGFSCDFSDAPAAGEKVILSDGSSVAIPDGDVVGEMYSLKSMVPDGMLRNYFFGQNRYQFSYCLTSVDSGVWLPHVDDLRSALASFRGDQRWSENLSCRMGYCGSRFPNLTSLRHAGIYRCGLWRMYESSVSGIMDELSATPPPVRVTVPRQGSPVGSSMLYVTDTVEGAEILMGWQTHGIYERMYTERNAISQGVLPAINGIIGVGSHADHWYAVDPFSPFGSTGDVKGVRIDPNGPSLCVYDWGRHSSGELWRTVQEKLNPMGVERMFSEGSILHDRAKSPHDRWMDPGNQALGTNVIKSPMHDPEHDMRYHAVETGGYLVHHVKLVDESPQIFPIVFGSPSAVVALRGKMVVESPLGLRVNLEPNQAALVPAMRHGDYYTQAREGSAEFFVVQGVERGMHPAF